MITMFILFFETLYWVLTGGHCFEHLAGPEGGPLAGMAMLLELFFEIVILGGVIFIIDLWRSL